MLVERDSREALFATQMLFRSADVAARACATATSTIYTDEEAISLPA